MSSTPYPPLLLVTSTPLHTLSSAPFAQTAMLAARESLNKLLNLIFSPNLVIKITILIL
jgi:hypothetical protein